MRINAIICSKNSRTQGKADTINLEQLITFLNEKQRDPTLNEILYPLYDEKRALEIINDYEQNEVVRNESKNLINKSCSFGKMFLSTFLRPTKPNRFSCKKYWFFHRYLICLHIKYIRLLWYFNDIKK